MVNILVGLLALGLVSLVTFHSVRRPERITRLLHDTPVIVMYLVGTWMLVPLGWPWAAGYVICIVASNLWFLTTVCSRCRCHGRSDGPSLYCVMAGRLAKKGDVAQFARSFRRNSLVMAVGWILPPVGAIVLCVQAYGRGWTFAGSIVVLVAFCLIAFWLLPVGAKPRCGRCDNRDECPHGHRPQPHR